MTNALTFYIFSPDNGIAARWQKAFRMEGWKTVCGGSCLDAGQAGAAGAALDLLEIGVPGCETPEDLRSALKARRPVSALVFGDQKTPNTVITAFLDAGADDFVYKNIDERVLAAKLKAHIRRLMPAITRAAAKCVSSGGGIELDSCSRAVRLEGKTGKYTELLNLTQKEFDILAILVGNEHRVVTREVMLEKLWGMDAADVYAECVDKHIESLRRKLGPCGKKIKTIYGAGYMFKEGNNG